MHGARQLRTYIRDGRASTVHTYSDIAPTSISISLHPSPLYEKNCCFALPWICTNMALARNAGTVWLRGAAIPEALHRRSRAAPPL